jgi:hypothetical protein
METIQTPPEESGTDRRDRHQAHQTLMREQTERRVAARERHKRDHGRTRSYSGNFY